MVEYKASLQQVQFLVSIIQIDSNQQSMIQQKRTISNNPKFHLDYKELRQNGKKIHKNKQIKSKIFKNLSEFPIQLNHDHKDTYPNVQPNRPHSSLLPYEQNPRRSIRIQSALSHYPQPNRKKFSLDSNSKKNERDSLLSRNSLTKKLSKNNKSIDESIRARLGEDRRKYNLSCSSAIDERMKFESKTKKKNSMKNKRPSVNNLHLQNKRLKEGKQNMREVKDLRNVAVKEFKENRADKSKSKSKNRRKKSTVLLDKSKMSTSMIGLPGHHLFKKKQSVSTVAIVAPVKKAKEPKKKPLRKKMQKIQAKNIRLEEISNQQYPINKYDVDVTTKKPFHANMSHKPRSKSRKGSSSKEGNHRKTTSMLSIDYNSCINIPSNSSGLIVSRQSQNSPAHTEDIKIMDNWEFKSFVDTNNPNQTSVNLDEIRYYESFSYSKKKQEREFIERKFRSSKAYCQRREIEKQITEDFPHFTELELKFLASVIFIQRKWRWFRLYNRMFKGDLQSPEKLALNLEKTNSKQLQICQRSPDKSIEQERRINLMKDVAFIKSALTSTQTQNTPFDTLNLKDMEKFSEKSVKQLKEIQEESPDKFAVKLNVQSEKPPLQKRRISELNRRKFFEDCSLQSSNSLNQDLSSASRYSYLSNQLFPSMKYLLFRKQQIKQNFLKKISELTQLHKNKDLSDEDYLKLRQKYEKEHQSDMQQLGKSKHDIEKGYLKFIDTIKSLKHEALRKVSSESGPMAALYHRVFQFDQSLSTPSNSSDSIKRLKLRVLIRKQFFQTHKTSSSRQSSHISPFLDMNFSDRHGVRSSREPVESSSRYFRKNTQKMKQEKLQGYRKKEIFLDLDEEQMEFRNEQSSPKMERIQIYSPQNVETPLLPISLKQEPKIESVPSKTASNVSQSYEREQQLIFQELITILTHELFLQMLRIDEKRDNLIDIVKYETEHKKLLHVQEYQIIGDSPSQSRPIESEPLQQQRLREIYRIEGLQQRNKQSDYSRKHRNSNTYNISPASSEKVVLQFEDILKYIQELFCFLRKTQSQQDIIRKINKNQGFSALEYLKFLRDLQIPDEEYEPLLSNEMFAEWQDDFYDRHYPHLGQDEASLMHKQTITIFHRCIFESLISFLEENRPCGEKGLPFPWQKVTYFSRMIEEKGFVAILDKCELEMMQALKINCGIIDEKYMAFCEEDMERIHEDNEDRIINMLEGQLQHSAHNWYELQEHCLQIRLQLQSEIFEYLMLEALDQVLQE